MKAIFSISFFLSVMMGVLSAQPAVPATPADPNQARPAVPVTPDAVTPPPAPSTNTTTFTPTPTAQVAVTIIAESSLKAALQEIVQAWADSLDNSPQVPITLTNSGTLRAKVESGAPFDVIISADVDDVKAMTDKGILFADGQRSLARNTLVVYGKKPLLKDDDLDWFDLTGTEWKKVALGNPELVASGRVAKRALQKHGLINDDTKGLYVYAQTDALALGVVQREQADAVFLYKTDAANLNVPGFDIVPIKTEDAPPIFYTAAVCRLSKNPTQAHAFIDFCTGDAARPIWAKYGFETN
jgi:molybdate transport system substrate-binding protein